ncbi:senC-like protein [Thermoproteus uzoniensis 768-20]|uniref:SenC-like protein n=1 Tax=Thermoproteus uzoniensis (strain 768-20) TaxID=999630 RepID=F2L074_THEU7|nr:SCO family protein [Thermoproteus uzoniensis]AEA12556.1 senC-like protein [Thermoproteus uzoniensis 768-20]
MALGVEKTVRALLFAASAALIAAYSALHPAVLEQPYRSVFPLEIKYFCAPVRLPHIELVDQYGRQVGFPPPGVFVLSFGYTHCPDVCPLTFRVLNQTQKLLHLSVYIVTVDPAGDTPERLRIYAEANHYNFTFLTGQPDALREVWNAMGVYVQEAQTQGGYVIYHSVVIALVVNGTAVREIDGLPDPTSIANFFTNSSACTRTS